MTLSHLIFEFTASVINYEHNWLLTERNDALLEQNNISNEA